MAKMTDKLPIVEPEHYTFSKTQPIEVIEEWGLNFNLGNVIKYIARHQYKGSPVNDLKKAQWYLSREIEAQEERKKTLMHRLQIYTDLIDCRK